MIACEQVNKGAAWQELHHLSQTHTTSRNAFDDAHALRQIVDALNTVLAAA